MKLDYVPASKRWIQKLTEQQYRQYIAKAVKRAQKRRARFKEMGLTWEGKVPGPKRKVKKMSRSGYTDTTDADYYDDLTYGRWRGMVESALRGKRGQIFLKEMLAAFDAMPEGRLIASKFEQDGEVCAIGAVGKARGVDMSKLNPDDPFQVGNAFNISYCMVQEIVFMNDEACEDLTPEGRYEKMRAWVEQRIKK